MSENASSTSSVLWGAWRQGLGELAQVLPAFPDSVRPVHELGAMGAPTPQLITEQSRLHDDDERVVEQDRGLEIER